jgi:siroheme synthase
MTDLSALADELDALVRDGRRIRLGQRNFEQPHAELDELVTRLAAVARVVRLATGIPSMPVVTGRGQVLVSVARAIPGRHIGPSLGPGSRADRYRPRNIPRSEDDA